MIQLGDIQTLGVRFGIEVVTDLCEFPLVKEKKPLLPYDFAKKKLVLPLEERDQDLLVAMADPLDLETVEEIRCLTGKVIKEVFAHRESIEDAIEKCYRQKENAASQLLASLRDGVKKDEIKVEGEGYDLLEQHFALSPVIRILNAILLEAIQQGASDILLNLLKMDYAFVTELMAFFKCVILPPKNIRLSSSRELKSWRGWILQNKGCPKMAGLN